MESSMTEALAMRAETQQLAINRLTDEFATLADQTADALSIVQSATTLVPAADRWASPDQQVHPWCLRDLDDVGREQLLRTVVDWVEWLLTRYPLASALSPCWLDHPEMVEEIVAAHQAWAAAYRGADASPYGPAEWHERWLPGLEQRLTTRWKARRCDEGHRPTPVRTPLTQGATA